MHAPERDWRLGLPILTGVRVVLREPCADDAPSLFREICGSEVCRFLAPPPVDTAGVERMIARFATWRREGEGFCFVIQPVHRLEAVGILQLRARRTTAPTTDRASWEWGFALGPSFWGTGLFHEAARMLLSFRFTSVGLQHVEALVHEHNRRAHGAMRKLGGHPTHSQPVGNTHVTSDRITVWSFSAPPR